MDPDRRNEVEETDKVTEDIEQEYKVGEMRDYHKQYVVQVVTISWLEAKQPALNNKIEQPNFTLHPLDF